MLGGGRREERRDERQAFGVRGDATRYPLREKLLSIGDDSWIDVPGVAEMRAQGNIVDHEFDIEADGTKVAEVSKKWFRVRDSYGVEVAPGQDDALVPGHHGLHRPDGLRMNQTVRPLRA